MKRRVLSLIATVPFWYFLVAFGPPHQRIATQFGPFKDVGTCESVANSLVLKNDAGFPGPNPFLLPNATATSCWSDS